MTAELLKANELHKVDPVFGQISFDGHEQVVFCNDKDTGLKAIIGIHNTVLGPALGGTRMWKYANEWEALNDVLRLSRGMSFKSSISDTPSEEKANAQLASDKEASSVSSSSGLFIFLGVLLAILIMLFVIKIKRQKEQKELIDSMSIDKDKLYSEIAGSEAPPIKEQSTIEDIDLSGTTSNLSDKDQKPAHFD